MSAVKAPTLVIGVGGLGRRVANALEQEVSAEAKRLVRFVEATDARQAGPHIDQAIAELTRIRLGQARSRLDISLIADLSKERSANEALHIAAGTSALLRDRYSALFPVDAPPDQRGVCLVALFATPPVTAEAASKAAVNAVWKLERWHRNGPPVPILSRIQLIPSQNELGRLDPEDVERALYLFANASWFSGLRDEPAIRSRIEHQRDPDRLVSAFNAAACGVPVEKVMRYCQWRTAGLALERLATRCEIVQRSTSQMNRADGALAYRTWLNEFDEGEAAQLARKWAVASASADGGAGVPDVPWYSSAASVRAKLEVLFADESPSTGDPDDTVPDDNLLNHLDRVEWELLESAQQRLKRFVAEELDPSLGLERLGALDRSLEAVEAELRQVAIRSPHGPETSQPDDDRPQARQQLEKAIVDRADPLRTIPAAFVFGAVVGVFAAGMYMAIDAARIGGGAGGMITRGAAQCASSPGALFAWGLGSGLVCAVTWFLTRLRVGARRLDRAIQAAASASASGARRQISSRIRSVVVARQLDARRRRVARALADAVGTERRRLESVRVSVRAARDHVRRRLNEIGHRDGSTPGSIDAPPILQREAELHRLLIPESALPDLWRASRQLHEDEALTVRVLEAAWPEDGIEHDLPFTDEERWVVGACRGQHDQLLEKSAFEWPGVRDPVTERLQAFLRKAPEVLGLGVRPLDEHGQPLAVGDARKLTIAAPVAARGLVQSALQFVQTEKAEAYGESRGSRVVVLRTHPGFSAQHLVYSIQQLERRSR